MLLVLLLAMLMMRMGHYIGIPTSHVIVFKLGWVFALFPHVMQYRLVKSIATINCFPPLTAMVCRDDQPARGIVAKRNDPWLVRIGDI